MDRRAATIALAFSVLAAGMSACGITQAADDKIDYIKQIKPLLALHCTTCHGPLRQKGGLRLDAAVLIRKGGESGTALVPGQPNDSLLFDAVTNAENTTAMPKEGGRLKDEEIALLRAWITQGAVAPASEKIAPDPRKHWSFMPPVRPEVPKPKDADWQQHPIDAFLAIEHERRGLVPQPPAPKHIQLRRVYLDLIGLPPAPGELQEFLTDDSPTAYQKVVNRLLDRPRYGERWGRHWMDVWRYSDWYGYQKELRNSARHIWRWRDWIVDSLNDDTAYDHMLRDMLAADEIAPGNADRLRATGFLARNYYKFNRNTWLDSTIEHTGKAFLGLTLNCARCHDHMYDPIAQSDYYRFRAIFEPHRVRTDRIAGQADVNADGLSRVYDADAKVPTYIFQRGNDKHPDKKHPVTAGIPEFLSTFPFEIEPVILPIEEWYPGRKKFIRDEILAAAATNVAQQQAALEKTRSALNDAGGKAKGTSEKQPNEPKSGSEPSAAEFAVVIAEKNLTAAQAHRAAVLARIAADDARYAKPQEAMELTQLTTAAAKAEKLAAFRATEAVAAKAQGELAAAKRKAPANTKQKTKAVLAAEKILAAAEKKLAAAQKVLEKAGKSYTPLSATYAKTSTGRRRALARWITDRNNPLTARVAVNHIWMRHFGSPLVSTVFEFGQNGKPPSHPELLDWLAVELMENGWRMKHLHRLIVTSRAYRMRSSTREAAPQNRRTDPDNIFLWRMNSRRMESELVRDSVLAVSGQLDLQMGGPEIDAQKLGQTTFRRSIYYRHAPEKLMTFLTLFDTASTNECYRRNETVIPQQALALINSRLSLEQSRRLATRLNKQADAILSDESTTRFIDLLFDRVLCRPATAEERQTCRSFLSQQTKRLSDLKKLTTFSTGEKVSVPPAEKPHLRARENLVHVLLNHNEFITVR